MAYLEACTSNYLVLRNLLLIKNTCRNKHFVFHQYSRTITSYLRYRPPGVSTVPCQLNLTGPEGYIEAPPPSSSAFRSTSDCSYTITVYTGYGVEVQVRSQRWVDTGELFGTLKQ